MRKVGFIGLGTMGFPMAGHLQANGFDVVVWNRSAAKAERWRQTYAGEVALQCSHLVDACPTVLTCLGNDTDVRSVYCGAQGLFATAHPGTLFIDHTTTSAELARELAQTAEGLAMAFVDAPVSGGEAGAQQGQLSVMVGGDGAAVERAREVMGVYAKVITHLGGPGSGQLCKMVNQICIAGVLQGLSEALVFAEHSGLDVTPVHEAIAAGAAGSWQLQNRWQTMHARRFDFGFAVDWMRKDLQFCLDEAERLGIELPATAQVAARYEHLQVRGEGRSDTSVLIKQFDPAADADSE